MFQPDQLEAAYRGDWIVRKAIEIPAFDSPRMWRAWHRALVSRGARIEDGERGRLGEQALLI